MIPNHKIIHNNESLGDTIEPDDNLEVDYQSYGLATLLRSRKTMAEANIDLEYTA